MFNPAKQPCFMAFIFCLVSILAAILPHPQEVRLMKKQLGTIPFFALSLSLLICMTDSETYAAQLPQNQLHYYLRSGIERIFNLDTRNANIYLQKAVELDKENPAGYAFLALAHLFIYEMSFEPEDRERNQENMLRYVSETINRGEKRIEKNSRDGQAYFAMALAKIAKIRWAIGQKKYFIVAQESSKIWDYLEKAKEENPQNYDIYFPAGLLHYHLDHLQGITRFFSSLMITSGNRQKGIQELELTAQKGDLLKELAQAELASVYSNFENQPARALPIARELKDKFPHNYNFSFALANSLSDLHRFEEASAIAREIEKGIQAGKPPFVPQLQSRCDQLMGRIFFNQGEYTKAGEYCQRALKDTSPYNARVRAWAFVRLGMIYDTRKERKQAEDYYSKALDVEGGEGAAQVEAKKYLKTPYVPPPKP
jgi:Tfp pilus assembly protein PilF